MPYMKIQITAEQEAMLDMMGTEACDLCCFCPRGGEWCTVNRNTALQDSEPECSCHTDYDAGFTDCYWVKVEDEI